MTNHIDWLIPNQVILITYIGAQNYDTLYAMMEQLKVLAEASPEPHIHTVSDMRAADNVVSLPDTLRVMRRIHTDKNKHIIMVGESGSIIDLVLKLSDNLFHTSNTRAQTMEEAIAQLKTREPNLDWDALNSDLMHQ